MCTGIRFIDKDNNLYFGRNLDIECDCGQTVIVTPRNFKFKLNEMPDIVINKAIIGMGISLPQTPLYFDAANEDGLCMAGLNFPGNAYFYEHIEEGKMNITPNEFLMWTLGTFSKVSEVEEQLSNVRLINEPVSPQIPVAPLHWIISDAEKSIVVEQTKDGLKVYENTVGVLTNNPSFPWHLTNLNNYVGISNQDKAPTQWSNQKVKAFGVGSGTVGLPGDSTPPSRFVRAAYALHSYPDVDGEIENVTKFFNILRNVAMPLGTVVNLDGKQEFTVYTSCYSAISKTYYYEKYNDFNTKKYKLNEENMNADDLVIF